MEASDAVTLVAPEGAGRYWMFAAGTYSRPRRSGTRTFRNLTVSQPTVQHLTGKVSEFRYLSGERLFTVPSSATTFTMHEMLREHFQLPVSCLFFAPTDVGLSAGAEPCSYFLPRARVDPCFENTGAGGSPGGRSDVSSMLSLSRLSCRCCRLFRSRCDGLRGLWLFGMALCVLLNTDHDGGIGSLCPLRSLFGFPQRYPQRYTRGPAREDAAVGVIAVAEGLAGQLSTVASGGL